MAADDVSPMPDGPEGSAPSAGPATTRVVIAEDEALIRLDLAEMLREEGFDVVGEASDGEQAVALATELRPDLVICDIKMPKMDGIAAAGQIMGKRIAPVVMLTAFSQRDLVERARDAGAMAYLVKPFEKRDLLPAIEMAMSRFAEIKALEAEVTGLRDRLEARKLIERAKARGVDNSDAKNKALIDNLQQAVTSMTPSPSFASPGSRLSPSGIGIPRFFALPVAGS